MKILVTLASFIVLLVLLSSCCDPVSTDYDRPPDMDSLRVNIGDRR